jgi:hypothetical protein
MRLRQDKHSAQQFALAVGMPSIDTKVDAANWPPSPLKRRFRPRGGASADANEREQGEEA